MCTQQLSECVCWADCTATQLRHTICAHKARPAGPALAPAPLWRFMEWVWEADPKAYPTAGQGHSWTGEPKNALMGRCNIISAT